ncbi:hypothetical protein C8J56DRAFT_934599 [Mycena floridula]|nr:hypothetical protein C8J56DRAFT_934599 [Mycena floridula]
MSTQHAVTRIHVQNLHCASCVTTIQNCLFSLPVPPLTVDVSVVLQSVTVYHPESLSEDTIRLCIANEGFDIVLDMVDDTKHDKHLQNCLACQQKTNQGSPTRATLSIGGMTCSACTNSVQHAIAQVNGVSEITVSLLDNSATVLLQDSGQVAQLLTAINGCGFEASVISLEPLVSCNQAKIDEKAIGSRSVSLYIEGFFCTHCPEHILSALPPQITVTKPPTLSDPILTIQYIPRPPTFTIRSIIAALSNISPQYNIKVWHAPTVEQRSRYLQRREQRNYLLRLAFTLVAAIPTFIIGIVYMTLVKEGNATRAYLMHPIWGNVARSQIALFVLATPVMFYSAAVFHRRSIKEIRALWRPQSKTPIWKRFCRFGSMNLLVSSGVSVAYFSSVALLALAASQPPAMEGSSLTYFDTVVLLTMFLLAGRFLEAYSKARTADAVSALASLRPTQALLVSPSSVPQFFPEKSERDVEKADSELASLSSAPGTTIEKVDVDLLEVADVIRVLSGCSPAQDGILLPGYHGSFDESSLTGESKLVHKEAGDQVFLGTINRGEVVHIQVDKIGGATMLDNIVKVVREGITRRAPMERIADTITGFFVPVVTLLAILTWIIWLSLGLTNRLPPDYLDNDIGGYWLWSLEFAIALFVVACPCGIGLAAPTALLVGSGIAAKFGILARGGGEAFQEMSKVQIVVFDKTGTLTEGADPRVADVEFSPDSPWDEKTVLAIAAELESTSSHPLAAAILQYCVANTSETHRGTSFSEIAGRGLKAHFEALQSTAIIGNEAYMQENGLDPVKSLRVESWKAQGKSVALLAIRKDDGPFIVVAGFSIADTVRTEAPAVIRWLQGRGISTWMISGDNRATAAAVAAEVGIPPENVLAQVLPHEKADKIEQLQQKSRAGISTRVVAFVGDGINDAPALTIADVGIAIGSGSDVAISSASFVILSSRLDSLMVLLDLSKCIIHRVKFNFCWALVYNAIGIPIAGGVLYALPGHPRLSPVWASLAMALSSVSVICSSLLLRLYKVPKKH